MRGSDLVTVSWSRFGGDREGDVERQMAHLEALYQADAGDPRIAHYRSLRKQWSAAEIVRREIPQRKGNLVGNADHLAAVDRGLLNVTFHHSAYVDVRQRTPRMRFGNAHVYNVIVKGEAAGPPGDGADRGQLHDGGRGPGREQPLRRREDAARLLHRRARSPSVEAPGRWTAARGPSTPIASEPQDADELVFNPPRDFPWPDRRRLPYAYRLDAVSDLRDTLHHVGVIVPASAGDEARLRRDLLRTRH